MISTLGSWHGPVLFLMSKQAFILGSLTNKDANHLNNWDPAI